MGKLMQIIVDKLIDYNITAPQLSNPTTQTTPLSTVLWANFIVLGMAVIFVIVIAWLSDPNFKRGQELRERTRLLKLRNQKNETFK